MASRSRALPFGDRGDVVLGWLTKLVVTLSVLGLMAFDAVSLGTARLSTEDSAQQAARAAAASYDAAPDLQAAYDAALDQVLARGDSIDPASFRVDPADGSVTLTLRHDTATLLVEKVGPLRKYAVVTRTATGRPPA